MSGRLVSDTAPPDGFGRWLASIDFGHGLSRYRRLAVEEQLGRLAEPRYWSLVDGGRRLATYMIDRRRLMLAGLPIEGCYRGMLAVDPACRGRGFGTRLVRETMRAIDAEAASRGTETLSFGCIEADNSASLATLAGAGATVAATLDTRLAYWQWPRTRLRLERLDAADPSLAETERRSARDARATADLSASRLPGFRVCRSGVVALQARVAVNSLSLVGLGETTRRVLFRAGRMFPPFAKRFDPDAFRYIRLARLHVDRGTTAADLDDFLSSLLASHDAHFAMTMLDPASRPGRLRALSRRRFSVKLTPHHVVTRWHPGPHGPGLAMPCELSPPDV